MLRIVVPRCARLMALSAALTAGCGQTPEPAASGAPPVVADPWQSARERGVDFRALGQEPGWFLEIDDGQAMRLVYDYAEREATAPVPAPGRTPGTVTYDATTDAHRLRVVIEDAPCADGMSGDAFPQTVTVTIDGRELTGCGRSLRP